MARTRARGRRCAPSPERLEVRDVPSGLAASSLLPYVEQDNVSRAAHRVDPTPSGQPPGIIAILIG